MFLFFKMSIISENSLTNWNGDSLFNFEENDGITKEDMEDIYKLLIVENELIYYKILPDLPIYKIKSNGSIYCFRTSSYLEQIKTLNSHNYVKLLKDGSYNFYQVSILVCRAFLNNYDVRRPIYYKDKNYSNISINNLYQKTEKEEFIIKDYVIIYRLVTGLGGKEDLKRLSCINTDSEKWKIFKGKLDKNFDEFIKFMYFGKYVCNKKIIYRTTNHQYHLELRTNDGFNFIERSYRINSKGNIIDRFDNEVMINNNYVVLIDDNNLPHDYLITYLIKINFT